MAKKAKDVMKPVFSTGVHACPNCFHDVTIPLSCPVCGDPLRGFFFPIGDYAEIIAHLRKNATNKVEVFFFGDALMYALKNGVVQKIQKKPSPKPKTAPKKKPVKKLEL